MQPVKITFIRGDFAEEEHWADVIKTAADGSVQAVYGDGEGCTFWRSAAKPFQALPFVAEGGMDRYGLTDKELALMVSSHGGETRHVLTLQNILQKIGLTAEDLQCGAVYPLNKRAAMKCLREGKEKSVLYNPCSGKHVQILALCRLYGWSTENYYLPEHPAQCWILRHIAVAAGLSKAEISCGIDGCGVPVFYLPLANMAFAYARLGKPSEGRWGSYAEAVSRIGTAMVENPLMVAGTGMFDTVLMEVTGGRIIAKTGTDAVYCLADRQQGYGLALKVRDGSFRAVPQLVIQLLWQWQSLTGEEYQKLNKIFPAALSNHRQENIGRIIVEVE